MQYSHPKQRKSRTTREVHASVAPGELESGGFVQTHHGIHYARTLSVMNSAR